MAGRAGEVPGWDDCEAILMDHEDFGTTLCPSQREIVAAIKGELRTSVTVSRNALPFKPYIWRDPSRAATRLASERVSARV